MSKMPRELLFVILSTYVCAVLVQDVFNHHVFDLQRRSQRERLMNIYIKM